MSTLTMAPPRFVFFDLGNVIMNFDHAIACRKIAQLCDLPAESVEQILFHSDLQQRYETGAIDTAEFHDEFCRRTGTQPPLDEFERAGSDIFSYNVSVVPIIIQLYRSGIGLGILSNTCAAHWEFIRRRRITVIETCFQVYALSYELKAMKPAPEIFARAVELSGVAKENTLFVDDRPENVDAARAFGIDTIHFTSAYDLAAEVRSRGIVFNY